MNLLVLLEMSASAMGERVAVGGRDGGLTFEQLFDRAGRAATWLRGLPAQRVLYAGVSSPTLPVALYAASWAGLPYVPLNYRLADDRLRSLIARQAPAVLICDEGTGDRFSGIDGIEVVTTDEFEAIIGAQEPAEPDWPMDEDDIAVLLHTSGTTGDPKVAVLRQKHLTSYVLGSVDFMGADENEATLVSVPPYHIAGIAVLVTSGFSGRRIVQLPAFEPAEWVNLARDQVVSHAMVVPTMLGRILDELADGLGLPNLHHLSYGGGRMPLPVIERAMALLPHVDFVNAYGLTETSSSVAVLGPQDHRDAHASDDPVVRRRLGSVGRPLPTVEISIRDPMGEEVPAGEKGEIWVRGDQVSGEYSSRRALDTEGWFPTNDAGSFDEEGYLFIDGRIDDVIIRGGENLSPGEIEDVLLQHSAVKEAAVVGVPDTDWGEAVVAVVVTHEGAEVTADELIAWVVLHLRSSRRPSRVEFRDELPYNETGKLLRRQLKAEFSPTE